MDVEIAQDLALAAYEAMANGLEHAYPNQEGPVTLIADHHADTLGGCVLSVEIRDQGRWRPPPADRGWRGRGLTVMARICDHLEVDPGPTGTTVRMRWQLT